MASWIAKLRRAAEHPGSAWSTVRGRIRGALFTHWCRLVRPRVEIGRNLILDGKLKIRGPGRVIIGNNVHVGMLVTPYTYAREAVIQIGDRTFLNGARFGCRERIEIGPQCILAECRLLDYDFHSIDPQHRNDPAYVKARPITVGENVWITMQCVILKGVTIGRNCTVTPNSVVRTNIPPGSIAGGNPSVVSKNLSETDLDAESARTARS
jgi:acetyltransferase-like isoleucine patch superfamily enzyme